MTAVLQHNWLAGGAIGAVKDATVCWLEMLDAAMGAVEAVEPSEL